MRKILAIFNVLAVALLVGVVSGCSTAAVPIDASPGYSRSVSPQRLDHQRKQQLRHERGNYKRLYRPRDCRSAEQNCDGFPTF